MLFPALAVPLGLVEAEAVTLAASAAAVWFSSKFQDVYDSWTDRDIQSEMDVIKTANQSVVDKVQAQVSTYETDNLDMTAADQVPSVTEVTIPDMVEKVSLVANVQPVAKTTLLEMIEQGTALRAEADNAISAQLDDLVEQSVKTNEFIKAQNEILLERNKALEVQNKISYELVSRLNRLVMSMETKNELYATYEPIKLQTMVEANSLAKDIRQGNADAQINQHAQAVAQSTMAENAVKQKEIAVKRLETQVTDSMGNTKAAIDHELEMYAERRADLAAMNSFEMTDAIVNSMKAMDEVDAGEEGILTAANILEGLIFDQDQFGEFMTNFRKFWSDEMEQTGE